MNYKISRRKLLTAGGAFLTLPLLESFYSRRALAAGTSDPRRLIMIHLPNGTYCRADNPNWFSAPDGALLTAANAPIPLQPFTANLSDLSILKGMTQSAKFQNLKSGAGDHGSGKASLFTGKPIGNISSNASTISGDSFDVMYAKMTPQKRIVYLGTSPQGSGDSVNFAYELSLNNGANVVPEINPISFYNTYFANLMGTVSAPAAPSAPVMDIVRNPAILNMPMAALKDLQSKLGKNDRSTLEAFVQGLADLRKNLTPSPTPTPSGGLSQCSPIAKPSVSNPNIIEPNGADYFSRMLAFNSLIATGFQCDLFRSISISFGQETGTQNYGTAYPSNLNYKGVAANGPGNLGDHLISHHQANFSQDAGATGTLGLYQNLTRDTLHAYIIVDLINKLKAVTDPSGSKILDNTAIMAAFCVYDGEHGTTLGMPVINAGGRNFRSTGYSLNASTYDINDLYYTLSTYLGMGLTSFNPIAQISRAYGSATGRTSGSTIVKWTP